uniref:OSJNBb0013O03.12 protein n=1 Tax=Oryza sativa subsp. japonica TaxID=39947 RepID=Q7F972_ORYSJ|nr:OSJNBb0013O03.12 [Oryza sativa Japonica Group]
MLPLAWSMKQQLWQKARADGGDAVGAGTEGASRAALEGSGGREGSGRCGRRHGLLWAETWPQLFGKKIQINRELILINYIAKVCRIVDIQ